ncbi:MAG: cytochrome c3 family protein [Nitrospirae bacterium]|nr:cytochrome c3 family protein [Nitrospirota bacterium]
MRRRSWTRYWIGMLFAAAVTLAVAHVGQTQPAPPPNQQVLEDITNTKHNLSSVDPSRLLSSGTLPRSGTERDAKSVPGGTSEICVFCHTPHGASATGTSLKAPIWNRNLDYQAGRTYQLYDQVWSFSFEGVLNDAAGQRPTGYSRLCLSCHDGTVALGNLINAPGSGGYQGRVPMTGNLGPGGTIPQGSGDLTGDTRRLGLDLRNDHPISFTFDSALALKDTELVDPGAPLQYPANKVSDPTPLSPVRRYPGNDPTVYDSVQCTSCHNPHQVNYPKFLRANWFHHETNNPDPTKNNQNQQIICLFCHDKPRWIDSTHAIAPVIRNKYPLVNNDPANPNSGYDYDGNHAVSEYACRNCHDPHTIQGAKRLHREGVNAQGTDGIESTCFLCHSPNTGPTAFGTLVAGDPTTAATPRFVPATGRPAPDVYSEFSKDIGVGNCPTFPKCGSAMNLQFAQGHEPVFTARSQEGVELYSPSPPAGNESPPGTNQQDSAHIECVDCHNPHQVVRDNRLRGMKGITFDDKVIETTPTDQNRPYVYEVCFRCHGNSYTNIFNGDRYPDDAKFVLGSTPFAYRSNPRVQPSNPKFSLSGFSNKRLEFATYGSPSQEIEGKTNPQASYVNGEPWGTDAVSGRTRYVGPGVNKAFHPVVGHGRNGTAALTKQLEQWSGGRQAQDVTIQCTDCHNSDYYDAYGGGGSVVREQRFLGPITESNTVRAGDVKNFGISQDYEGERSKHPIGPHGSNNIRILRAPYNTDIANPSRNFQADGFGSLFPGFPGQTSHWDNFLLCFQCHDRRAFDPNAAGAAHNDSSWTNFFGVPADPLDTRTSQTVVSWESNLHMYHMLRTGALCHECHYNVHSNAESQNTIYGDGTGCIGGTSGCPAGLPPDEEDSVDGVTKDGISDTHLINFAPGGPTSYTGEKPCDQVGTEIGADAACSGGTANPNPGSVNARSNVFEGVEGVTATKPVWYYSTTVSSDNPSQPPFPVFRCNLRCHGVVMSTCFYIGNADRGVNAHMNRTNDLSSDTWCAGGRAQTGPVSFGAAPPAIQKFLAEVGRGLLPPVGDLDVEKPKPDLLKLPARHVRR